VLLTFDHVLDDPIGKLVVDEHFGNHRSVKMIRGLGARDDGTELKMIVVVQQILDQERLSGVSLANHYNNFVVIN
jgi:predicted LPLAT superfamily acyltransferase